MNYALSPRLAFARRREVFLFCTIVFSLTSGVLPATAAEILISDCSGVTRASQQVEDFQTSNVIVAFSDGQSAQMPERSTLLDSHSSASPRVVRVENAIARFDGVLPGEYRICNEGDLGSFEVTLAKSGYARTSSSSAASYLGAAGLAGIVAAGISGSGSNSGGGAATLSSVSAPAVSAAEHNPTQPLPAARRPDDSAAVLCDLTGPPDPISAYR